MKYMDGDASGTINLYTVLTSCTSAAVVMDFTAVSRSEGVSECLRLAMSGVPALWVVCAPLGCAANPVVAETIPQHHQALLYTQAQAHSLHIHVA